MFEAPQTSEKSGGAALWIVASIIIVLAIVGGLAYMNRSSGTATGSNSAPTAAASSPAETSTDAVHDLRVVSAKMDKDYTGTTAVWTVDVKNQSGTFTYTDIMYETTYAGADNSVLLQNSGKIPINLGPGEEETATVRDALYPSGTAWYKFRVTGAAGNK